MSNMTAEKIGERYTPDRERATLPYGTLWEADDAEGGRALLLLCKPGIDDPDAKAEAVLQASDEVDSPHVVAWSDGGVSEEGCMWLAAPWMGSASFSEHVTRCNGLAPSEAARIVHQVARALEAGEAVVTRAREVRE